MRYVLSFALLLLTNAIAIAQDLEQACFHHGSHPNNSSNARTTVASLAEDNYDVKYVKLDVAVNNTSTNIKGSVLTRASVVSTSPLVSYVFELDIALTVDSVLLNGVSRPVSSSGTVRTVTFAAPQSTGTLFTAQVFYHGAPGPGSSGIRTVLDSPWSANTTFTLSEPYFAHEWWPCKQSLRDKIDSADIWVTVPDSLKAGSNGVLQAVTTIDATHKRYEWKERHIIDYYLISLAVGPYTDYSYYMHYTGSTDSTLIQNYVYNNPAYLPACKSAIDSTGMMIDYFSRLFGRYRFWKEKYGHAIVSLGGAMEHQTMTTIGSTAIYTDIIAHELVHHWFGDNVTCATWADIMVNEGFARYSQYLFKDHFNNHTAAISFMLRDHNYVKSHDTGAIYVNDTTNSNRIFDGRLSYSKGSAVLHMLRSLYRYDDSSYFRTFRIYQQQYQDGNATIEDFKNIVKGLSGSTINGMNVDTFFNQWVYREGFPKYSVRWNQVGNDVMVQINQTTSAPSSVSCFTMPINVTLYASSTSAYTSEWAMNNAPSQAFHFAWPYAAPMTDLYFDPAVWLLHDLDTIIHDTTLVMGVPETQAPEIKIAPNPATTGWEISNVPANSTLTLTDLYGRTLWQVNNANASLNISADQLAAGMYILRVSPKDAASMTYKLIKQ